MQICHPQPHPRLKNVCLHHGSDTAGTAKKRPSVRTFRTPEQQSSPCAAARCQAGENLPVKDTSSHHRWGGGGVRVGGQWGADPCQRSRPGNGEGGILLAR